MDKQSAYSHIVVQFCLGLDPVGDICFFFFRRNRKQKPRQIKSKVEKHVERTTEKMLNAFHTKRNKEQKL